ncbi:hypothetical protein B4133_3359 [Bacillus altitudinis]|nr:hypothetical protein B4133_3359 [Bacillus altitudinis]
MANFQKGEISTAKDYFMSQLLSKHWNYKNNYSLSQYVVH